MLSVAGPTSSLLVHHCLRVSVTPSPVLVHPPLKVWYSPSQCPICNARTAKDKAGPEGECMWLLSAVKQQAMHLCQHALVAPDPRGGGGSTKKVDSIQQLFSCTQQVGVTCLVCSGVSQVVWSSCASWKRLTQQHHAVVFGVGCVSCRRRSRTQKRSVFDAHSRCVCCPHTLPSPAWFPYCVCSPSGCTPAALNSCIVWQRTPPPTSTECHPAPACSAGTHHQGMLTRPSTFQRCL